MLIRDKNTTNIRKGSRSRGGLTPPSSGMVFDGHSCDDGRQIGCSQYLGGDALLGHSLEPLQCLVAVPGSRAGGDGSCVASCIRHHAWFRCCSRGSLFVGWFAFVSLSGSSSSGAGDESWGAKGESGTNWNTRPRDSETATAESPCLQGEVALAPALS